MALVCGGLNYYGDAGIAPSQPGNEDLQWEKLWITNLAVHLGFWNRLNVDVELYHKKNSAMLMEVPVSYTTSNGFGFRWDNVGDMTNRGVEVSLAADVIQHKDFVWSVNANVSYNRNKMTKLYSGVSEYELSSTNTKLVVGHSFGEFYLNRFAGVNPANGDALWYTKEGELTTELRRRGQGDGRQELRGALAGRLRHDAGLEGTFAVGTVQLGRRPLDDCAATPAGRNNSA